MNSKKRYLFVALAILGIGLLATLYNYFAGNFASRKKEEKKEMPAAGKDKDGRVFELAYVTIDKDLYDAIAAKDSVGSGEFLYPVLSNEISRSEVQGNTADEAGMRRLLKKDYGALVLKERSVACLFIKCLGQANTYHCFLEAEKAVKPSTEMLGPGWIDTGYDENGQEDTVMHDLTSVELGTMQQGEGLFVPLYMLYGYGTANEDGLKAGAVSGMVYVPKFIRYYNDNGDTVRINIAAIVDKPLLLHSN